MGAYSVGFVLEEFVIAELIMNPRLKSAKFAYVFELKKKKEKVKRKK